jgi:dienelactone hydrolase
VAVLKGEGRVPILFGSLPLPVPPNRSAYIARPDLAGSYATVVIATGDEGITPSVKALARHLARYGYASLAPQLRQDVERAAADVGDAIASARIPGTEWADGDRVAVVGLGSGGIPAGIAAAEEQVDLLVLIDSSLDGELLAAFDGRLLVLHGDDDTATPGDEVRSMRADLGRGEWVLYRGVGGGFFDDAAAGHDPEVASDVRDRLVAALDARFGAVPVA